MVVILSIILLRWILIERLFPSIDGMLIILMGIMLLGYIIIVKRRLRHNVLRNSIEEPKE
ncbi:hypothetical protein COV93_05250 [Candidatus Woesearchaeota archaeon CG11_big_fil_rev_8_21_14_0_20_43_8]|nr:MAG: hypothetical protein COV93_05250 [Candidatus Woesearchaeota archaeon CG11_big_fil_rev_8_21_14_0_20_43_8]